MNRTRIFRRFRELGPGVISGAANDDPSCILTFALAGATLGYRTLWLSLACFPLLTVVQLLGSRLGMVSGRGLAGAVRAHYSRRLAIPLCALIAIVNTIQLGADLGGMAQVAEMVTGVSVYAWAVTLTVALGAMVFYLPYRRIVSIFRWLCLVLFTYAIAAFLAKPDWAAVARATFVPSFDFSPEYLSTVVAIVGATFSPYLFFWQAQSEVEEEFTLGRRRVRDRLGASPREMERSTRDVVTGAFFSKFVTYFITLTTAATLFTNGRHEIATARDAAAALQPVAGPAASWLFALGVFGTGVLAIPVLAGSAAYAVAETFRWHASLEEKPAAAPRFYGVLLAAMAIGLGLIWFKVSVVKMLFWASVLNGVLAPFTMAIVVWLTARKEVMGDLASARPLVAVGWTTAVLSALAAVGMLAAVF